MADTYDALETRSDDERAAELAAKLPKQIAHAKSSTGYFAKSLNDVDPAAVTSREALAKLPVIRKSDLLSLQEQEPPFGGLVATDLSKLVRVFMSPGPIYEPQGEGDDPFRFARALYASGFRPGDLVHNTFSYHLTPGGWLVDGAVRAFGCAIFPAGVGNTELQVRAVSDLKPQGYVGTPSFLRIILDKAKEMGVALPSLTKGLVSGEALPPSLRTELKEKGVSVLQCYATADVGLISYESDAMEGMIVDEGVVVEIVRPGTGEPVPEGEVGEVVVTTFSHDYPLVRFGTGDMSAVMSGTSPCGRTNMRIKGWMGRADQTTKIKGMFVHPSQVADILKRHDEISKARLEVTGESGRDSMTLVVEVDGGQGGDGLADALRGSLSTVTKLKGDVRFVATGELPNDGKVIDDQRSYE